MILRSLQTYFLYSCSCIHFCTNLTIVAWRRLISDPCRPSVRQGNRTHVPGQLRDRRERLRVGQFGDLKILGRMIFLENPMPFRHTLLTSFSTYRSYLVPSGTVREAAVSGVSSPRRAASATTSFAIDRIVEGGTSRSAAAHVWSCEFSLIFCFFLGLGSDRGECKRLFVTSIMCKLTSNRRYSSLGSSCA